MYKFSCFIVFMIAVFCMSTFGCKDPRVVVQATPEEEPAVEKKKESELIVEEFTEKEKLYDETQRLKRAKEKAEFEAQYYKDLLARRDEEDKEKDKDKEKEKAQQTRLEREQEKKQASLNEQSRTKSASSDGKKAGRQERMDRALDQLGHKEQKTSQLLAGSEIKIAALLAIPEQYNGSQIKILNIEYLGVHNDKSKAEEYFMEREDTGFRFGTGNIQEYLRFKNSTYCNWIGFTIRNHRYGDVFMNCVYSKADASKLLNMPKGQRINVSGAFALVKPSYAAEGWNHRKSAYWFRVDKIEIAK